MFPTGDDASVRGAFADRADWAAHEPLLHLPALADLPSASGAGSGTTSCPSPGASPGSFRAPRGTWDPGTTAWTTGGRSLPEVLGHLAAHLA